MGFAGNVDVILLIQEFSDLGVIDNVGFQFGCLCNMVLFGFYLAENLRSHGQQGNAIV